MGLCTTTDHFLFSECFVVQVGVLTCQVAETGFETPILLPLHLKLWGLQAYASLPASPLFKKYEACPKDTQEII